MRKYLLYTLCGMLLLTGCDYLNRVPEKDIETVESLFEQRTKAEAWWKGLYGEINNVLTSLTSNTSFLGADEFVTCQALYNSTTFRLDGLKVADGLQMSQSPYGSLWYKMYTVIRNANTFLENIDNTYNITEEDREWWKADVKALKAFIYFELVRRYGPICLVPQNMPMELDVSEYQLPRQHVDTCFKEIVRLLDEAAPYIPMHNQRDPAYGHTICLEALHALKAKALLYAASPLFNGNVFYSDFKNKNGQLLFNSSYDRNKWLLAAEAADKAAEICAIGDRDLYTEENIKKTKLLNQMNDIESSMFSRFDNKEYLMEMKWGTLQLYRFTLPRLLNDDNNFNESLLGCLSPSMKMVEEYYTSHGLPIDADNSWSYANRYKLGSESSMIYEDVIPMNTSVVNLHLRREPRFYASIAGDRMYWQRGTNTATKNYNLLVEAHKDESWGTQEDFIINNNWQNINGYWLKKQTFANFATSNYVANLKGQETYPVIRLAEVYMMQAEAWNEYLDQPDSRVYDPLDKVRKRAGILPVREAWKTFSNVPTKVDTKVGMREIIRQEYNIEFAFEGHRYWNIRRWLIAHQVMNEKQYGWNVLGTTFQTFYNNENGPIVVWSRNKFVAPRDFLEPFNAEEILISGMVQNPGW